MGKTQITLDVKAGGTCINHSALKGYYTAFGAAKCKVIALVPFTPRGIRACPSTQLTTVTLPEVNEQGLRLGKSVQGMELVLTGRRAENKSE
jgi:hypothetical protein